MLSAGELTSVVINGKTYDNVSGIKEPDGNDEMSRQLRSCNLDSYMDGIVSTSEIKAGMGINHSPDFYITKFIGNMASRTVERESDIMSPLFALTQISFIGVGAALVLALGGPAGWTIGGLFFLAEFVLAHAQYEPNIDLTFGQAASEWLVHSD